MNVEIRRPAKRVCTRCGRVERWNEDETAWQVDSEVGEIYCVHDWDITGEFTPVQR